MFIPVNQFWLMASDVSGCDPGCTVVWRFLVSESIVESDSLSKLFRPRRARGHHSLPSNRRFEQSLKSLTREGIETFARSSGLIQIVYIMVAPARKMP